MTFSGTIGALPSVNENGRIHAEKQLGLCQDFSAAYMGVQYLTSHIQNHPETITQKTINVLVKVLESEEFARQKQVFFLFSHAAQALVLMAGQPGNPVSRPIIPRLQSMLTKSRGNRLRALGQALGDLPVPMPGPFPDNAPHLPPLTMDLNSLAAHMGLKGKINFTWQGRSLLMTQGDQTVGVVKFATSKKNIDELGREIQWMDFLHRDSPCSDNSSQLPTPLIIQDRILFTIPHPLPQGEPDNLVDRICIAFIPCPGYFDYPNEFTDQKPADQIKNIFYKNARHLGALTRRGIFHTALIPLFHNRVQQGRRNDNGAYLWEHGGRLDQWLDSCRYPNFAASGLRDFEHLVQADNSRQLRHYIGEHLLSFILVIGSYFRNKAPWRRGRDENMLPADTSDLFTSSLFLELLNGVCESYFSGLVEEKLPETFDPSVSSLVQALISAMGRDENMEEILRVRDQDRMNESVFIDFLRDRGVTDVPKKGEADIVLDTGPHLGGFNQAISVPELIDHLFRFSAFCVSHCFLKENELKA